MQMEWLAVLAIFIVIAIHLYSVKETYSELQLILLAGSFGLVLDSTLISLGVFFPANGENAYGIAPLWLVCLWMLFSITINHSMRWLHGRYVTAALLGFIFAPIAYLAGQRLGALSFPSDQSHLVSLVIIACCWLIATPLFFLSAHIIARRNISHDYS